MCEAYGKGAGEAEVCNNVLRFGIDYIYISHVHGSQTAITTLLHNKVLVFRVICHYYLPQCGNFTHNPLLPSSLCQEVCAHVQTVCKETWEAAALAFVNDSFIDCNDTSKLLFPLPNCCTGAGIRLKVVDSSNAFTATVVPSHQPMPSKGAVIGIVVGVLVCTVLLVFPVVMVLLVIRCKNIQKRKLLYIQYSDGHTGHVRLFVYYSGRIATLQNLMYNIHRSEHNWSVLDEKSASACGKEDKNVTPFADLNHYSKLN